MKILLLNQTFYPDVVSTAQHAADLACALAGAGHEVTVMASRRAYDSPGRMFARRETWRGVRIVRLDCTGLGKSARWRRGLDFLSFLASCSLRLLAARRYDTVIAMTSPPLISFLASLFVRLKGGRLATWIMDLNPDEAIAAGWLVPSSLPARLLAGCLRGSLRASESIVVLDEFMKARIVAKGIPADRLFTVPPWTHDSAVHYDEAGRREFREAHGLNGKFVVMYSGNHSPCHPLDTLLEAAQRLAGRPDICFCFVGGGSEYPKVREFGRLHGLTNIVCLPYQPLERLSASLSAADLHVVAMGDPFVGIVHPCKIYNVLRLGIPFLYIGPEPSHITQITDSVDGGAFFARHGDAAGVVAHVLNAALLPPGPMAGHRMIAGNFSETVLLPRMLSILEPAGATAPEHVPAAAWWK